MDNLHCVTVLPSTVLDEEYCTSTPQDRNGVYRFNQVMTEVGVGGRRRRKEKGVSNKIRDSTKNRIGCG